MKHLILPLKTLPSILPHQEISRRQFLQQGTLIGAAALANGCSITAPQAKAPAVGSSRWTAQANIRPDLLDVNSPKGIEVLQLTAETGVPSSHVYMEAPVFTPDSKRLVLHRSATAHGSRKDDPEHRYLLCDLENGCALSPLTNEVGVTGPAVSPDGKYFYYFVNETEVGSGRLTLKHPTLSDTPW